MRMMMMITEEGAETQGEKKGAALFSFRTTHRFFATTTTAITTATFFLFLSLSLSLQTFSLR
jgi:hypothetical protein|tara:strand:- start:472 stop:657 length:186 start_codon:yes stop_codon:yes gene_type:complete